MDVVVELDNGLFGIAEDLEEMPAEGDVIDCWVDDGMKVIYQKQRVLRVLS
ncbi:hypothetical protein ACFFLZ_12785 [Photobacterium aphoticum]|uniref:Uncharacterized protein n=1 Tax=Photobacterium aphoticum TaxID=754436 RepID=A0A090QS43_9GAMM|nr:hypothetical protein [Photobacterium aphoticum]GAL04654.1 hypothetical protein JCM19237_1326 [Photobacterium aphoticum]GHA55475.1 hypothetical protein GCM10007086_31990 [Photobacterium aphoticum]